MVVGGETGLTGQTVVKSGMVLVVTCPVVQSVAVGLQDVIVSVVHVDITVVVYSCVAVYEGIRIVDIESKSVVTEPTRQFIASLLQYVISYVVGA